MSKTVIYGGSFDPIHIGHVTLAKYALEETNASRLLFIPALVSPFKNGAKQTSFMHRFNMCQLACEDIKNASVSDLEGGLPTPSYTVNTLSELKKIYGDDLVFVCGADSFMELDRWKNPKEIFRLAEIFTAVRDDVDLSILNAKKTELEKMGAKITLSVMSPVDVSSSQIRYNILNSIPYDDLVPLKVARYIEQHNLYRE